MSLVNRNYQEMTGIIANFVEKFQKNKSISFDLINVKELVLDVILFYKETSQIPLNAVFLNFDIKKVIINFQI